MHELASETNAWACYDCGKCTAVCPLTRLGSSLSPRRHVLAANLGAGGEIVHDPSLFACLTCGLCEARCPAEVDYTALVLRLRELAHCEAIEPECPHGGALQSVMRMMAKGGTEQDRLGWLEDDLEVERERGEVFLFVGCTPYYDAFFPELELGVLDGSRAAVRLLNRLSVTPVVSPLERCCGHDLLWNGDRASFDALARHNVELVKASGARTLVTPCAECARTWRADYQPLLAGTGLEVLHLSELLAERVGELELGHEGDLRVTFQDPCRLGRHLGVYDAPRAVLAAVPGVELAEMGHSASRALCCAGGTWSSCDRYAKRLQVERLREARTTGAELLVTACPKCQIHFACAMQDPKLSEETTIEMRDLAEVVAQALA